MKRKMVKTSSSGGSSGHDQEMYIYELPLSVRDELCNHLDELNVWQELAKYMDLPSVDIHCIRNQENKGNSPTKEVLKRWGDQYNHTVAELFYVFYEHKLYQAMRIIKDFVVRKYHYLIPSSQPNLSLLLPSNNNNNNIEEASKKLLNCSLTSSGVSDSQNNSDSSSARPQNVSNSNNSVSLNEANIHKYASSILEINYNELCEATKNWSDANILGKGGFGTVYKGFWKHTEVAIKLMHYKRPNGTENVAVQIKQSLNELKFLNSCRHDNILPLYGYSVKGEKPCLVYQLMMGGSLEEKTFGKREPLPWKQRVTICLGTARGINYLHTFREKPLIHGDIKPANILLDYCLTPKIGDFGLAREGPNAINTAVEVTQVFGTKFYLPPEFVNSKKLSTKVDTFGFGIVVLETFTALRAFSKQRTDTLPIHVMKVLTESGNRVEAIIDRRVPLGPEEDELCKHMLNIGLRCTSDNPDHRPEMVQVLEEIRYLCDRFNIFFL